MAEQDVIPSFIAIVLVEGQRDAFSIHLLIKSVMTQRPRAQLRLAAS